MAARFAQDTLHALAVALLAMLVVAGSAFVWIGIPVLGLWAVGQLTTSAQRFAVLAIFGIPLAMVCFGWLLYRINAVYERLRGGTPTAAARSAWLRSSSDERRRGRAAREPRPLIDIAMSASAWTALALMLLWFFLFAEMRLFSATAQAAVTADLKFATDQRGAVTGYHAEIDYTTPTDSNGRRPAVRGVRTTFPPGSALDTKAAEICQASAAELRAQGFDACPPGSKVGEGTVEVIATQPPASLAPIGEADITIFNSRRPKDRPSFKSALLVAISVADQVQAVNFVRIDGNVVIESIPPACSSPLEQPPCGSGEFTAGRVEYTIDQRSRTVNGRTRRLITTPEGCPGSGAWGFGLVASYSDGTTSRASSSSPCTGGPEPIELRVTPDSVDRCSLTRFVFTARAGGRALAGATVRFAHQSEVTNVAGRAAIRARLCQAGERLATVKAAGFRRDETTVTVTP